NDVIPIGAKIIQVDIDAAAVGKYYPVEIGVAGDATSFASCLADNVSSEELRDIRWRARNGTLRKLWDELWREREQLASQTVTPLTPEQIFGEIRKVLPRNAIIALDSGTLCRQAADQLQYF